jgi:hypothetical protein
MLLLPVLLLPAFVFHLLPEHGLQRIALLPGCREELLVLEVKVQRRSPRGRGAGGRE